MGETRTRKSKKASKPTTDNATRQVSKKLENLSLHNDSSTTLAPDSEALSSPTQNQDPTSLEDRDEDEDDLQADPSYIEIQTTEHKGQSIFAARKIPTGTLILSEPPLIRLTQAEEDADKNDNCSSSSSSSPSINLLSTRFQQLPKPVQKAYLTLFDSQKSDFPLVKSIYYSNCYNLSGKHKPSSSSAGGSCIGTVASRINHGCTPNVQFSFDEDRNRMLFYAIKPIPKGREVLSTYDSVYEAAEARGRKLMLYYGFRCDCEACVGLGFWSRSDERRRGVREGLRTVRECERYWEVEGKLDLGMDPVGSLMGVEALLVKEGLVGLPLADVYRALVKWSERLGDARAVRKWRAKELEVCTNCLGRRAERVRELRAKIEMAV